MIKNVVYFFSTFSHFFVTADDYQFSSKTADFRTLSVHAQRLFTVFQDVSMVLIKWVIILEFAKRLHQPYLKTLLECHFAIMTKMGPLMKATKNLTPFEDISIKLIERNCLVSSYHVSKIVTILYYRAISNTAKFLKVFPKIVSEISFNGRQSIKWL